MLILDSHEVMFVCIRQDIGREKDACFMLGPMSWKQKSKVELHYYYRDYGMKTGTEVNKGKSSGCQAGADTGRGTEKVCSGFPSSAASYL